MELHNTGSFSNDTCKLMEIVSQNNLGYISFYSNPALPPSVYIFFDEERDLTGHMAYILSPDISKLSSEFFINSSNFSAKCKEVVEDRTDDGNFLLYVCQKSELTCYKLNSRAEALKLLLKKTKKVIVEKGYTLRYGYSCFHRPPEVFFLTKQYKPTGTFAIIVDQNENSNMLGLNENKVALRPNLMKFFNNGLLI